MYSGTETGSKGQVLDYIVKGGVTYRVVSNHLGSPSAAANTAINLIAVTARLEGGIVIGAAADALGNALADETPCPEDGKCSAK